MKKQELLNSRDYIQQSVDVGGERIEGAKLQHTQSKSTGDDGIENHV